MHIIPTHLYTHIPSLQRTTLVISASAYFQGGVRQFFTHLLELFPTYDAQLKFRAIMILDELATNAIEFGSTPEDEIALTLYCLEKEWIEVTVEDVGRGVISKSAQDMTEMIMIRTHEVDIHTFGLRGRGLSHIICPWANELSFLDRSPSGLLVRARMYVV